jgi:flagellar basal-body rod modification protein FlgD
MANTISPISGSTAATAGTAVAAATTSPQDQQDRFLKLLVSQMKNQDPLAPMDNAQVTAQMAQISTVNGVTQLNDTLKSVMEQLGASQILQGASLAGHNVMVSGNTLSFDGSTATGGFELDSASANVTLSVLDASGKVVNSVAMGAQPAGLHAFEWDGKTDTGQSAAVGQYTFKIDAGAGVNATTLAHGRVNGVANSASGLQLNLGALGNVAVANVRQIL